MATTAKKSTKAKNRTVSSRVSNKKASTKKTAKVEQKSANKAASKKITLEKIYKFNLFTALASAVFAVVSAVFLSKQSADFTLGYSTKDQLASDSATVLGSAHESLATVEIRYLLAFVFGLAAVFSLLLATQLKKNYEAGIKAKVSGLRWVFVGITSALTLEIVSILGGVEDIVTLKLVAGLVLITSILGWVSELQNQSNNKNYGPFYLSLFSGVLAWLPLISGLIFTGVYGAQRFSWYVYAASAALLFGFVTIALNQYRYIKKGVSGDGYIEYEGRYITAVFLINASVFVILLIGLLK